MDITTLRKMRTSDLSKIAQAAETITQGGSGGKKDDDNRFWKLTPDKAGNASALIRFLPRVEGDELPWIEMIDHGFQGANGKWYIEKSLATIGQDDPVSQVNSELWNNGTEAGKEQARKQKRRKAYYANILVINDSGNTSNNGQVRLFKFGKKIMDKILDKARPTFADEKPVNVFDFWEGADFKLRMKKVDEYPNYDTSVFAEPTQIAEADHDIVKIANAQYKLSDFHDPKNFKTYAELKTKLDQVLGTSTPVGNAQDDAPVSRPAPAQRTVEASTPTSKPSAFDVADDVDQDSASYFQSLAND